MIQYMVDKGSGNSVHILCCLGQGSPDPVLGQGSPDPGLGQDSGVGSPDSGLGQGLMCGGINFMVISLYLIRPCGSFYVKCFETRFGCSYC
jgi:hypothetical protein